MNWRHRISVLLLVVLMALPVSGAACASLCSSAAARGAAHRAAAVHCAEHALPSSGPAVTGTAAHDCTDHDWGLADAATTSVRPDSLASPSPHAALVPSAAIGRGADAGVIADRPKPPGSVPPTAHPPVLRV